MSPVLPLCCPQDHIEPILLEHARSLGVDARFGVELTGLVDDGAGVHTPLRDRASGAVTRVHARFAVGADGPRSTLRQVLGIPFDRLGSLGPHINIMFRADLDPVLGPRRYPLYFLGETGRPNVVFPLGRGRWGYLRPADVPLDDLVALVRGAAGVPTLDVQVIARLQFELAGELARSFRSGNVFLVGDSAHRMTPRGAVGMNTAIQGAHNLGWKLAWVSRGWAGAALLDSYEDERRPPAELNTLSSVQLERPAPPDRIAATLDTRYTSHVVAAGSEVDRAAPGTRAPHVWIRHRGRDRSTLDIFDGALTLLVGDGASRWRSAAAGCPTPYRYPPSTSNAGVPPSGCAPPTASATGTRAGTARRVHGLALRPRREAPPHAARGGHAGARPAAGPRNGGMITATADDRSGTRLSAATG